MKLTPSEAALIVTIKPIELAQLAATIRPDCKSDRAVTAIEKAIKLIIDADRILNDTRIELNK